MKTFPHPLAAPLAAMSALALAACSPEPQPQPVPQDTAAAPVARQTPQSGESATLTATPAAADANTLTLQGLGDLRLGEPVPKGSSFAERGAQIPGSSCHTISSPDYPGVHAMTTDGVVRRITLGDGSKVKLIEGIGVGASEKAVRAAFPGFDEEPHKYIDAPGKYLTTPRAGTGSGPALRFEIGPDRMVQSIHVGLMPELTYVEGCA